MESKQRPVTPEEPRTDSSPQSAELPTNAGAPSLSEGESAPASSATPSELASVKERLQQIPPARKHVDEKSLRGRLRKRFENLTKEIGTRQILRLFVYRKHVRRALGTIPKRMQLVTNQARLVLELIDDFLEGTYRDIPWHSIAIASGALVYSVSPADVVPDFLPIVGSLDDMAILSVAMRWIEKDLRAYCVFKGYDVEEYFPSALANTKEPEPQGAPAKPDSARGN